MSFFLWSESYNHKTIDNPHNINVIIFPMAYFARLVGHYSSPQGSYLDKTIYDVSSTAVWRASPTTLRTGQQDGSFQISTCLTSPCSVTKNVWCLHHFTIKFWWTAKSKRPLWLPLMWRGTPNLALGFFFGNLWYLGGALSPRPFLFILLKALCIVP